MALQEAGAERGRASGVLQQREAFSTQVETRGDGMSLENEVVTVFGRGGVDSVQGSDPSVRETSPHLNSSSRACLCRVAVSLERGVTGEQDSPPVVHREVLVFPGPLQAPGLVSPPDGRPGDSSSEAAAEQPSLHGAPADRRLAVFIQQVQDLGGSRLPVCQGAEFDVLIF